MVADTPVGCGGGCLSHSAQLPGEVNADFFGSDHGDYILQVSRCLHQPFRGLWTNSKDMVVQIFTIVEFILPSKHVTANG